MQRQHMLHRAYRVFGWSIQSQTVRGQFALRQIQEEHLQVTMQFVKAEQEGCTQSFRYGLSQSQSEQINYLASFFKYPFTLHIGILASCWNHLQALNSCQVSNLHLLQCYKQWRA